MGTGTFGGMYFGEYWVGGTLPVPPGMQDSEPGVFEPGTNEPGAGTSTVPVQERFVPYVVHLHISALPVVHLHIGA